jgi:hypothetical protein
MAFKHMIRDIMTHGNGSAIEFAPNSISPSDYEQWKKQYTWDALHDLRYGQSFCNYFGIQDHRIFFERNWLVCDTFIQREWIERH